jgi:adenylosuccinate synthase
LFNNPELVKIGDIGQEYGVTTGRKRKVNYLNLDRMIFALNTGGGNYLIISKCDVLEESEIFKLFYNGELIRFENINQMKDFITKRIAVECPDVEKIYYSSSPEIVEDLSV